MRQSNRGRETYNDKVKKRDRQTQVEKERLKKFPKISSFVH